jgi:hypothetical protein
LLICDNELILNPKASDYVDVVSDLEHEMRELKGLKYKQVEAPAPPKTLNLEHDIVKFIFEHGADAIKLVVTLLQLAQALVERRRKTTDAEKSPRGDEELAVLKVDDRTLVLPASDRAQRNFLNAVHKGKTKRVIRKKTVSKIQRKVVTVRRGRRTRFRRSLPRQHPRYSDLCGASKQSQRTLRL